MRQGPESSHDESERVPRESAGTGVASAWWHSAHPGVLLLAVLALAALAWWLWR
ncbi:MAG TPA: hypothetical protein VM687_09835 [Stenotrophomonas sp.]|nr:hypothetical protein [Stenotrophomonas sp.]